MELVLPFLIGVFCLLLVLGSFTKLGAWKFAIRSIVVLGAAGFVIFLVALGYSAVQSSIQNHRAVEPTSSANRGFTLEELQQMGAEPIETPSARRWRLGLPEPFETVLSMDFPSTKSQAAVGADGKTSGTQGWQMRVAEIPEVTPSTRKTGFFLRIEEVVVTLNGDLKLFCQNTAPHYQKTLIGCRPLKEGKDGVFYEDQWDWTGKTYPLGTKVEFYDVMNCTRELIDAKEPCRL